jgi:ABC-type multidrug transport system fused ATPase/permease subunit
MAMLRVIVSFGREQYEFDRFREQGERAVDERVKLTVRQTLFTLLVNTITAAGTAIVFGYGFYLVLEGQLQVGKLIVLLSYVAAVYQPLEQISGSVGLLHTELVQLRGSFQLLDTTPEVGEDPDAIELGRRSRGEVVYDGVNFSYRGRKDTLHDVSFRAEPGQRIAIVGPTGAGKTTLISLLVRLYDPREGRIWLDGIDLKKLKLHSLRDQISVVLQEPLLFSGTVAENIRYGRLDGTKDDIVEAARQAGAHDFIERLPQGYETELGERGAQLSGGERQRICVARAFIKDAPILILDEPTSSIDSKTEAVILDSLERLMAGRTSFMIAHRLSTVRHADKIVVIDRGRLVEQGTHEELLAHDGLYRQLHDAQTRTRRPAAREVEQRLRSALEGTA